MVNWRVIRDLFPRRVDSLFDAKLKAWAPAPGDGIRPPRKIGPPLGPSISDGDVLFRCFGATELQPMLMRGPQFDESGDWKRH